MFTGIFYLFLWIVNILYFDKTGPILSPFYPIWTLFGHFCDRII